MSNFIDVKYVNFLSSRLRNFKEKRNGILWNFSCPPEYCGDSKRKKSKARGYIFEKQGNLFYFCHRCGASNTFSNFLKRLDPILHDDYIKERYFEGENKYSPVEKPVFEKPVFEDNNKPESFFRNLELVSNLSEDHIAKRDFIFPRSIPSNFWDKLFYTENFGDWFKKVDPESNFYNEHRIIIPFYDEYGNIFAFQARAIYNNYIRYITYKFDKDKALVYGLERVTWKDKVYITEGPIDSFFLDNCISVAGCHFSRAIENSECVAIFDNEPRNPNITASMLKCINAGISVFFWPDGFKEKDLNELVIKVFDKDDLKYFIDCNTFSDMQARLMLATWCKK